MPSDAQQYLIAGGAAAIALAFLWRIASRHHQVSLLKRRLRHAEQPVDRARAGNQLIELGLRRAARVVLRTMPDEADDRVRLSVALGVARRQWEPTDATRVVELRRWAAHQVASTAQVREFGPAVTRLADMGGPRLPPRGNGAAAPAAAAPTSPSPGNGHGPSTEPTIPPVVGSADGVRWLAPADPGPT
jgi:hypothetical protein